MIKLQRNSFELKILSGTANPELSKEIAKHLKTKLSPITIKKFADGETYVKIGENVRGRDVFVIQPTCHPVNENLIELMIIIDALRRASAARITAVIPYYGYARQDRKVSSREPITSKLMANLLVASGVNRVLAIDLHSGQIQGFFDIPLDHLYALPLIIDYLKSKKITNGVVVAPDVGGAKKTRRLAEALHLPMAILDKRRHKHNEVDSNITIIGEIKGKNVIILDDIIDTAGTICTACKALKERGANDIFVCATHPVFSGKALECLSIPEIKEIVVTNTIPLTKEKMLPKIKVLSIAPLLAEGIKRIHNHESISELFDGEI
jgi:ribose-phosphate pyrophosphokinase